MAFIRLRNIHTIQQVNYFSCAGEYIKSLIRMVGAFIVMGLGLYPTLANASSPKTKTNSLFSNFNLHATGDLSIDQTIKMISSNLPSKMGIDKFTLTTDNLALWYQTLEQLDLDHINRIEAKGNVVFVIKNALQSLLKADRYVYTLKNGKGHVLLSNKNPIIYQDSLRTLVAQDRIEYMADTHVAVIRGHPVVTGKKPFFKLQADRFNIQLTDENALDFAEAVGAVYFVQNGTTVRSKYAIYYNKTRQIEFYDHVTLSSKSATLKGCAAVYNLTTGLGHLIPCDRGNIEGRYH